MRKLLGILAVGLFGLATPASAELVQLSISGSMQGNRYTIMCPRNAPVTCFNTYEQGNAREAYANNFVQTLLPFDLKQGDNSFSYGAIGSGGLFTGTITNTNGVLTGRDLFYSYQDPGVMTGLVGSTFITARASTFSVAAVTAVPEPGTWAMMLLGFLAVGTALRAAPRRALLPA